MNRLAKLFIFIIMQFFVITIWSLDAGPIEIKSGLDQKLNATLPLSDMSNKSKLNFQVSVSSEGELLPGINYRLSENSPQEYYLKITSEKPLSFPIVNLQIIADKLKQQIFAKEYTVLLDPIVKPTAPDFKNYGPVANGETLKSIANKVKPAYVNVKVASRAIFVANPHAFKNGDGNQVIFGSYLIIPDFAYHIKNDAVVDRDQLIAANKQLQDMSKKLLFSMNEINDRHENMSREVAKLEAKISQLLVTVSLLEKKNNSVNKKLSLANTNFTPQTVRKNREEVIKSNNDSEVINNVDLISSMPSSWILAGLLILILLVSWISYRLLRKARAGNREKDNITELSSSEDNLQQDESLQDSSFAMAENNENTDDPTVMKEVFLNTEMKDGDGVFLKHQNKHRVDIKPKYVEEDISVYEMEDIVSNVEDDTTEDLAMTKSYKSSNSLQDQVSNSEKLDPGNADYSSEKDNKVDGSIVNKNNEETNQESSEKNPTTLKLTPLDMNSNNEKKQ